MSSPSNSNRGALVPRSADLQRRIEDVLSLRKVLHDAYIVESKEATGSPCARPPPAVDLHRTIDAPTLALLKAPNYPFVLCEGAPPAYIPPPVPYDVEGEVDAMKAKVLKVQRDIAEFQARRARRPSGGSGSSRATPSGGKPQPPKLSREELITFLDGHTIFSELAWQVSALQWFYRWVLSHSISHLWNAKDQLEFVMTERDQELPESVEAMDAALERYPFPEAVSILDSDRQSVIAQERVRLRSVSRTYRDYLPPIAITAATSCYLSSEEKYMYQEFFNQSEHLLLLLDHTRLMERSVATYSRGGSRASSASRAGSRPNEAGAHALIAHAPAGDVVSADEITREAYHALSAEYEVIQALMDTIRERRRENIQFVVSDAEYERSRAAQFAVYGCVLSDMSIMAQQMAVAKEFLTKYDEWMQHHGFRSHDALMQLLAGREGGGGWPFLDAGEWDPSGSVEHHTFLPPPQVWSDQQQQQQQPGQPQPQSSQAQSKAQPRQQQSSRQPQSQSPQQQQPQQPAPQQQRPAIPSRSREPAPVARAESLASSNAAPSAASGRSPAAVADVLYTVLECAQAAPPRGGAAQAASPGGTSPPPLAQLWIAAALRQVVVRLARSQWTAAWLQANAEAVEEELLARLRPHPQFRSLVAHGSTLVAMVRALATLGRRTVRGQRGPTTEVRVALHAPAPAASEEEELKEDVTFALGPAEYERWSALADALWVQVSLTGAAQSAVEAAAGLCFQQMEKVVLPVLTKTSTVSPTFSLFYRVHTPMSGASEDEPATVASLAEFIQCEVPGSGHQAPQTAKGLAAQFERRYGYARATLAALAAVEDCGLLPGYACRSAEVDVVPFDKIVFLSTPSVQTAGPSDASVSVGLLPPGAVQLMRVYALTGTRRPPADSSYTEAPFSLYTGSVDYTTIGVLVGRMLSEIADGAPPVLQELYLAGTSTVEQAERERAKGVVPESFAHATRRPPQLASAPPPRPARAAASRRLIAPILRRIDGFIESADLVKAARESLDGVSPSAPRTDVGASLMPRPTSRGAGRRGGDGQATSPSPSPSAVRPRGG